MAAPSGRLPCGWRALLSCEAPWCLPTHTPRALNPALFTMRGGSRLPVCHGRRELCHARTGGERWGSVGRGAVAEGLLGAGPPPCLLFNEWRVGRIGPKSRGSVAPAGRDASCRGSRRFRDPQALRGCLSQGHGSHRGQGLRYVPAGPGPGPGMPSWQTGGPWVKQMVCMGLCAEGA